MKVGIDRMYKSYQQVIDMAISPKNVSLSLFNSEGFFWLTSAISFAFATEELNQCTKILPGFKDLKIIPRDSKELIDIFKASLTKGQVSLENQQKAKEASLYSLNIMNEFSRKYCRFFSIENSIVLGKTFFAHWLIYKIIELEWQQVLDREEMNENYYLLDSFIEESQELEELEKKFLKGEEFSQDEKIYLRSHWERVNLFWLKMFKELELLAGGWVAFTPPINPKKYRNCHT